MAIYKVSPRNRPLELLKALQVCCQQSLSLLHFIWNRLPNDVPIVLCALIGVFPHVGKRRYDRKQRGYGGQTKPVFRKKVCVCQGCGAGPSLSCINYWVAYDIYSHRIQYILTSHKAKFILRVLPRKLCKFYKCWVRVRCCLRTSLVHVNVIVYPCALNSK